MRANDLLGNQVRAEMKKRRLVFLTFFILCFVYLTVSLVFGNMGLLKYVELNRTKKDLERQVVDITRQNEEIKTQITLLNDDPFYKEKIAREEFGLAKPGEYIFRYDR
jgi:cell division protein FtsB